MGFITSPLDFSDSERQARAPTRPEDTPLPQTLSEVEEHRGLEVSPVETSQGAGEESGEHAQDRQNTTSVDPLVSIDPCTQR